MKSARIQRAIRVLLIASLVAGVTTGCKSQFRTYAETVAANIGRNADDVEEGFRLALPRATEAELELAASRAATDTAWIKSLGRRLAVEWEQQATLRAVAGGTCDILGVFADLGEATTPADVENVIRTHIRAQGLAETDQKVFDVAKGILDQLQSLDRSGSINAPGLALSLGCLPF